MATVSVSNISYDLISMFSYYFRNPNLRNKDDTPDDMDTTWYKYTIPALDYKILSPDMGNDRALKAQQCHFWNDVIPKTITFTGQCK